MQNVLSPIIDPALDNEHKRAQSCQNSIRDQTRLESALFIERARDLWKMKSHAWWALLGYKSFAQWAADPDQNLSPSVAYLSAQVVDICIVTYRIPKHLLYDVGEKKYQLLAPALEKIRASWVKQGRSAEQWKSDRAGILDLLSDAKSLSWSALSDQLTWKIDNWETYFRGKLTAGKLRSAATVADVLDILGLSDVPDEAPISLLVRGQDSSRLESITWSQN